MNSWQEITIKRLGYRRITIEWRPIVQRSLLDHILTVQEKIKSNYHHSLIATVKTYHTLTLLFDEDVNHFNEIAQNIELLNKQIEREIRPFKNHYIPVIYDKDSEEMRLLSRILEKTPSEIIQIHSEKRYDVHFFGFVPGFMYLGGLDPQLFTSRKNSVSRRIKQGSVAIAGNQTGIYPLDSPGGWWVIGSTEIDVQFDRIHEGDTITFINVSYDRSN